MSMSNQQDHQHDLGRVLRQLLAPRPAALALLAPGLALAGPTGENVVGGDANVQRPDTNTTIINQLSNRAAINWQTFTVNADEYVIFNQPGASSIVLNRVLGGDASYILGHMQANGQVFLLNPNGVYFTHGATLDVQGFLASTLDMIPDAFMSGDFSLSRSANSPANTQVINDGVITAGTGGYVVLAGDFTENTGIISANAGTVALVSGNALTLDIEGDGLVNFAVNEATLSEAAGVRNAGSLIADGGRVIMTARVANDLVATAVNNEGLVRAHSIEEREGEIYLVGNGGDVVNSGTLDADGENADGGRIVMYGDRDVTLADGGVQTAAGDANHAGGTLRFIAEQHLGYAATNTIRATGGTTGGFVEVSGHGSIALRGIPEIGPGGTFFIDPSSITIFDGANTAPAGSVGTINDAYIEAQLQSGVNVVLAATSNISANTGTSIVTTGTGNLTAGIGNMSAGTGVGAACYGLNSSLCQGPNPQFFPGTGGNIALNNLTLDIGGDLLISAQSGTVSLSNLAAASISIDASGGAINFNNLDATGNIALTGQNIAGNNIGSSAAPVGALNVNVSGGAGNFYLSNSAHVSGLAQIITSGGSAGNISIGGVVETGAINFHASGAFANVNIGSYASATSAINISATATSYAGGNVTVGAGLQAGGNIDVNAYGGASSGGNISISAVSGAAVTIYSQMNSSVGPGVTINGSVIATAGDASFQVVNGGGAALLTLNGDINANNNVTFILTGIGSNTIFVGGDVRATNGNVDFGAGIGAISYATGSHEIKAGGNITIDDGQSLFGGGAASVDYHAGGSFTYDTSFNTNTFVARDIIAGGNVYIKAANNALHTINLITAGHADLHFYGSGTSNTIAVSIGDISITGTGAGNHDLVIEIHDTSGGYASSGAMILGNITTASGEVVLHNFSGGDGADIGTITTGNITTQNFVSIETPGDITTGAIKVTRSSGPANVSLSAYRDSLSSIGGDITVNGGITVSGRANASNPYAAGVYLETLPGGHVIKVSGNVSITGAARTYSNASSNGRMGAVNFTARASDGSVDVGNLSLTGVGEGWIEVQGAQVSLGNIGMNIAGGSYTRNFTRNSTYCGVTCSITGQEQVTAGGRAEININNSGPASSASATIGNVLIDAPTARMTVSGYGNITAGGISIATTGTGYARSSAGTYMGNAFSVSDSVHTGGIDVFLQGSSNGMATLTGAMVLDGSGGVSLAVRSGTIKLRGLDINAAAGSFNRSGSGGSDNGGPFEGDDGGPHITEGQITGGTARVSLGGYSSAGSSYLSLANLVNIQGTVNIDGAGTAALEVAAAAVTVSGDATVTATHAQQDGTYNESYTNSSGQAVVTSGTVLSNWGRALADIYGGSGAVNIAGLSVTGPTANIHVEGGSIKTAAVSLRGSGGTLDVQETSTVNGVTSNLQLDVPNLLTGMALFADTTLTVNGAIDLDAVGIGGLIMGGSVINTQGINVNVTAADYTVKAPALGGTLTTTSMGDAIFGIVGAAAQVNGDVNITAGTVAQFGGALVASGDFNIDAGGGVTRTVPPLVQFINGLDSGDSDATIGLPNAFDIKAANININGGSGPITVSNLALRAPGSVQLNAGGNMTNGGASGSITAGALAISAGGNVNLTNTSLTVGNGHIAAVAGDQRFLDLLAGEDVVSPAGGPNLFVRGGTVSLGSVSTTGDYVYFQANRLIIGGAISTSDPDLLLQLAPFAASSVFGFENSNAGSGTIYVYNGTLAAFNAGTIALGSTSHSGNVTIAASGNDIDIRDTNLFVLTTGTVTGLEHVLSTGVVKDLYTLINGVFEIPQTDEIDTSQDFVLALQDDYALDDGEDEGDEEGEDTDTDTGVEQEDNSLIRQDTVDEDMMCR